MDIIIHIRIIYIDGGNMKNFQIYDLVKVKKEGSKYQYHIGIISSVFPISYKYRYEVIFMNGDTCQYNNEDLLFCGRDKDKKQAIKNFNEFKDKVYQKLFDKFDRDHNMQAIKEDFPHLNGETIDYILIKLGFFDINEDAGFSIDPFISFNYYNSNGIDNIINAIIHKRKNLIPTIIKEYQSDSNKQEILLNKSLEFYDEFNL